MDGRTSTFLAHCPVTFQTVDTCVVEHDPPRSKIRYAALLDDSAQVRKDQRNILGDYESRAATKTLEFRGAIRSGDIHYSLEGVLRIEMRGELVILCRADESSDCFNGQIKHVPSENLPAMGWEACGDDRSIGSHVGRWPSSRVDNPVAVTFYLNGFAIGELQGRNIKSVAVGDKARSQRNLALAHQEMKAWLGVALKCPLDDMASG